MDSIPGKLLALCKRDNIQVQDILDKFGYELRKPEDFSESLGQEYVEFYEFFFKYIQYESDFGNTRPPKFSFEPVKRMPCEFNTLYDCGLSVLVELSPFVAPHVSQCYFLRVSEKTTICVLKFYNGFEVIGTSACIDPTDYSAEIGAKYALKDAVSKAGAIVGYVNQEKKFQGKEFSKDDAN